MPLSAQAGPAPEAGTVDVSGNVQIETTPGVFTPVSSANVTLYALDGSNAYFHTWVTNGLYTIHNIPAGSTYHVEFSAPEFNVETAQHYRNWLGDTPFESQSDVLVVNSTSVAGVDGTIPLGSTISGTISNAIGATGVRAFLWDELVGRYEAQGFDASRLQDGTYKLAGLAPGQYILRFGTYGGLGESNVVYHDGEDYIPDAGIIDVAHDVDLVGYDATMSESELSLFRLAGADRFSTSALISQAGFEPGGDAVFVVNGMNFPDALSASPAASLVGAPVLLTTPAALPPVVKAEIVRLAAPKIYIIGGLDSVSAAVETELETLGDVERIAGLDRYETSRNVVEHFFGESDLYTAYVATGANFPDALAAGPAAANESGPVLLQDGAASTVNVETAALIADLDIHRLVIAGAANSVSTGVEQGLYQLPSVTEVQRRAGAGRYETAVLINQKTVENRGSFALADTVFLSTGLKFPDALAGSALAGAWDAPIFLVEQNCVPVQVLQAISLLQPRDIILLGGETTLGTGVETFTPC